MGYSSYYDAASVAAAVASGAHREAVGGEWHEVGLLQLEFLRRHGLRPDHTLLDIGCGCLRFGVQAVAYLEPGRYWGTDLRPELLRAGYEREIVPAGLGGRLNASQLLEDGDFSFPGIPGNIDFAWAISVFTHLPPQQLRRCLTNLAHHRQVPCVFYFTIFEPAGDYAGSTEQYPGIVTRPDRDPYHYRMHDVRAAAAGLPWSIEYIGAWSHPRNQKMVRATLAAGS